MNCRTVNCRVRQRAGYSPSSGYSRRPGCGTVNSVVHLLYHNKPYRDRDTRPIILCGAHLELGAIAQPSYICAKNLGATAVLQKHTWCTVIKCPILVNSANVGRWIGSKVRKIEWQVMVWIKKSCDACRSCIWGRGVTVSWHAVIDEVVRDFWDWWV